MSIPVALVSDAQIRQADTIFAIDGLQWIEIRHCIKMPTNRLIPKPMTPALKIECSRENWPQLIDRCNKLRPQWS